MTNYYRKLLSISKPARYIGNEINVSKKISTNTLNICLIFPDTYEIGMSHLGLQILYENINASKHLSADRFYMPWTDAINTFGKYIYVGVESKLPLSSFHLLGFSLCYELSYTNVINILKMSDIPIYSQHRDNLPIIVAGGDGSFNPSVLNNIIDVFFIGEMDNIFAGVCEEIFNSNTNDRLYILELLNKYDFCYVPCIDKHKIVKKRIFMDFSEKSYVKKPLIPLLEIIHDKIPVEITRGCLNGCRFCQAGYINRPLREKNWIDITKQIIDIKRVTGCMDYTLLALSLSDYTNLTKLIENVLILSKKEKLAFNLPSIRANINDEKLLESVSFLKKSGFTIAPEAGSQRLRNVINKNINEEDLINTINLVASKGWLNVKLYFMIGLPTERFEDIEAIVYLSEKLKKIGKNINKRFNISVSISNFVPKVFTPFQWIPFEHMESLSKKQTFLKEKLSKLGIKTKFHNIKQSFIEATLSRGDERVNDLLILAEAKGCIFDEWTENFNFETWINASKTSNVDLEYYAYRSFSLDDKLPWDNINTGLDKHFLVREFKKATNEQTTRNCIDGKCNNCGVCNFKNTKNILSKEINKIDTKKLPLEIVDDEEPISNNYTLYELTFSKLDIAMLLSATEVTRLFTFLFNMAELNIKFSEGFNKRPIIRYIYPLPVGVFGENEIITFNALPIKNKNILIKTLNNIAIPGIIIKDIKSSNKDKINGATLLYEFDDECFKIIKSHMKNKKAFYEKIDKNNNKKLIKLEDFLMDINQNNITLKIDNKGGFNFVEFLKSWNYNYISYKITRKHILIN